MLALLLATAVVAQDTTSTTSVPRIVGDPLPTWVVVSAGVALLAVILVAGALAGRRRGADRP